MQLSKHLKLTSLVLCFVFLSGRVYPQFPVNFDLNKKTLSKTSDIQPVGNFITNINFDSKNTWVLSGKGISKTPDNGQTWENFLENDLAKDESVQTFNIYNDIIWVSLSHTSNGETAGGGFIYSTDYGKNWTRIDQPTDGLGDSILTYGKNTIKALPVVVYENNVTYDIAQTKNTVWIASWSSGLRKSTDMGKTWQRVILPPDNLNEIHPDSNLNFRLEPKRGLTGNYNHMAFSVEAVDDNIILVGTVNGVNVSFDAGLSWKKYNFTNTQNPISGNWVVNVTFNRYNNTIWASTRQATDNNEFNGLSYSADYGKSWKTALPGMKVWYTGFNKNEIYAPTETGMYLSKDNGISWENINSRLIDSETGRTTRTEKYYASNSISSGGYDYIWIGNEKGLILNKRDLSGNDNIKFFYVSQPVKSANDTYAYPNPFNPLETEINIKYRIDGQKNVTIRILDFGMNLVRTVIQNAARKQGENIDYWNGKTEDGTWASNGTYFYRIDTDGSDPVFGKIVLIK